MHHAVNGWAQVSGCGWKSAVEGQVRLLLLPSTVRLSAVAVA